MPTPAIPVPKTASFCLMFIQFSLEVGRTMRTLFSVTNSNRCEAEGRRCLTWSESF